MEKSHGRHPDAHAEIDAARQRAAREGKRVAVVFGADWCPDCHAFQKALGHRLLAPLLDAGYVVTHVSVGNRDRNLDLMRSYGMAVGSGIPAVAILEPDGGLVAAQRDGQFRNSSALLSVAEIASFFERWKPAPAAVPVPPASRL
jgi:thiol-disulfide isomerase/thioredoxin